MAGLYKPHYYKNYVLIEIGFNFVLIKIVGNVCFFKNQGIFLYFKQSLGNMLLKVSSY